MTLETFDPSFEFSSDDDVMFSVVLILGSLQERWSWVFEINQQEEIEDAKTKNNPPDGTRYSPAMMILLLLLRILMPTT